MTQVKEDNRLSTTTKLGINLIQLIDTVSDVMVKLKDTYCLENRANVNYGDDYRSTTIPAYCNCKSSECRINSLVRKYKNARSTFDQLWPRLGYVMLL